MNLSRRLARPVPPQLRKVIYHLGGKPLTGRPAVAPIFRKNSGVDEKVIDFMINTPTSIVGTAPVSQTVVAGAPPPAPVETVVVAPSPGYVWVDGEWIWNGGWVWVTGHWIVPPYPHAVWIHGYWGRGPHGYRRVPGHWR